MEWINLHTSELDSPALVGAEPIDRATWLFLLRYCCGQENGGVIEGAAAWGDRKWQQLARVTLAEVRRESELWAWEGDDLRLALYPHDREIAVKAKREAGRIGGAKRTQAKTQAAKANGALGGRPAQQPEPDNPSRNPSKTQAETQGKSKDKSKSKDKDNTPPLPPAGGNEGADEEKPKAERKRNPLFDALAASTEGPPEQVTKSTARLIGVALADIRRVCPDLTPAEIQRRAANYRSHFREAALTASALAKHWARCDKAPQSATNATQWQPDRNADPDAW